MKKIIKKIPIVNSIAIKLHKKLTGKTTFTNSDAYWKERYEKGGNSGDGSYNKLANFKAEIINNFVKEHTISTIIEFGSGDGNQLTLAQYPQYIGFDVSPKAIEICRALFNNDPSKTFKLVQEYNNETADLTLSLDVIYHLIEDSVYDNYMQRLFSASQQFVIIYASNTNANEIGRAPHFKNRLFSEWIEKNRPDWKLIKHIPNRYPYNGESKTGSVSDFYFYEKSRG